MRTADGRTACDSCQAVLPGGFGVLSGLVTVGMDDGRVVERIFCYPNGCRSRALAGLISGPDNIDGVPVCSRCSLILSARTVASALLCADLLLEEEPPPQRSLTFCYVNDCAATLLDQAQRRDDDE